MPVTVHILKQLSLIEVTELLSILTNVFTLTNFVLLLKEHCIVLRYISHIYIYAYIYIHIYIYVACKIYIYIYII
jgi:hypothetical protein